MIKYVDNAAITKIPREREPTIRQNEKVSEGFNDVLDRAISESSRGNLKNVGLSFSKHALNRLKERNISMDSAQMQRLDGAVERAARKGSKDSLIISDDSAFIVNVPRRRIITAMDRAQMTQNVFTNIDSTVIA